MQNYNILTDEYEREITQHGSIDFPCAGYDESFVKFLLGEVPWHWHDEIEIVLVYQGATRVEYIEGAADVNCGECIFINAGVLHRLTRIGEKDCKILNFVLKSELLGGHEGTLISREYIRPICSNKNLPVLIFTPDSQWQYEVIKQFRLAFDAFEKRGPGYEMKVVARLMELWIILCSHRADLLEEGAAVTVDERRIKTILQYINGNYTEELSVSQMAFTGGISESECYRLFKRTLGSTPNDYLLTTRLQKAAIILRSGDKTVQEIAFDSGFNSSSYFSKKFKEFSGMTPLEYRAKTLKD